MNDITVIRSQIHLSLFVDWTYQVTSRWILPFLPCLPMRVCTILQFCIVWIRWGNISSLKGSVTTVKILSGIGVSQNLSISFNSWFKQASVITFNCEETINASVGAKNNWLSTWSCPVDKFVLKVALMSKARRIVQKLCSRGGEFLLVSIQKVINTLFHCRNASWWSSRTIFAGWVRTGAKSREPGWN